MGQQVRIRPPRWIWWFLLVSGTAMAIYIPIFLTQVDGLLGPGFLLFIVPPVLVALVGLVGVLRGRVPGIYLDVDVEDETSSESAGR